jgi:glycosyltransferase involved in cell wall biosynthesis
MRVAFITHSSELYGANRSLLSLIDGLAPLGAQSFAILPNEGSIIPALNERAIPYLVVSHKYWSSVFAAGEGMLKRSVRYAKWKKKAFGRLLTNLNILPQVAHQLKEWDIDLIYTNSSVSPLGAFAASWMRKPHVWHLREFGDLDYNLTLDWGRTLTNFVLRRASAQICISEAIRSHFNRGLVKSKCHVIYNGVATELEMDRLHRASVRTKSNGTFTFSFVGLIHPTKGHVTAIKALSLLKESFPYARLLIAGGGGDKRPLEELALNCGVSDQVVFLGYCDNPFDVYLRSDVVLMCSKNEAMGRVTAEAMATSKPVIGYKNGGTAELILHEHNGLLYEGGAKELAFCMRSLMERPEWARAMGENGWRIAKEKYSIEVYAESIYKILSSIVYG